MLQKRVTESTITFGSFPRLIYF